MRGLLVVGKKHEHKITFSRFSREICTFEKNVRLTKKFFIKFRTKMVLTKIFVAIILTKLQRSESRANVEKVYYAAVAQTAECEKKSLRILENFSWFGSKI